MIQNLNKFVRNIHAWIAITIILACFCAANAAPQPITSASNELIYNTMIPQQGDQDVQIQHKSAVAQGKLANGENYLHLSGTGTYILTGTLATSGSFGVIEGVTVNFPAAGQLTILDAVLTTSTTGIVSYSGTANTIAVLTTSTSQNPFNLPYNVRYGAGMVVSGTLSFPTNGCVLLDTGTSDITVRYRNP